MERYVSPHPRPTPYQAELLTCLIEEASEVQKAACKAQRFGFEDGDPNNELNNRQEIERELGDLIAVVELLIKEGVLTRHHIRRAVPVKMEKLTKRYLQHSPDPTR